MTIIIIVIRIVLAFIFIQSWYIIKQNCHLGGKILQIDKEQQYISLFPHFPLCREVSSLRPYSLGSGSRLLCTHITRCQGEHSHRAPFHGYSPASVVLAGPKQVGTWGNRGKHRIAPLGSSLATCGCGWTLTDRHQEAGQKMTPILRHPEWQTDAKCTLSGKTRSPSKRFSWSRNSQAL